MRIYLAARYERRAEMCQYAEMLQIVGHEITSSWLTAPEDEGTVSDDDMRDWALTDLDDLQRSDLVVSFTDGAPGRGGRHVEFGYALALDKALAIVGPREHIFHRLAPVFTDWDDFMRTYGYVLSPGVK